MTSKELIEFIDKNGIDAALDQCENAPDDDPILKRDFSKLFELRHKHQQLEIRVLDELRRKRRLKLGPREILRFAVGKIKHALNGGTYLPLPMAKERLDICVPCDKRGGEFGDQCTVCKCYLVEVPESTILVGGKPGKIWDPTASCPIAKWPARPKDGKVITEAELDKQVKELLDEGLPPEDSA